MHSKALLIYGGLLVLVSATYPLALLGHFAVDLLLGERQIARDLLYGYQRILAARLVSGWLGSLLWVTAFWLAMTVLHRLLPRLRLPIALAASALVGVAAVGHFAPIPPVFAWLLLASGLLHGLYLTTRARLMED